MRNMLFILLFMTGMFRAVMAQTAFQFQDVDCSGLPVDLYADLDAGKAVVLYYYMPDCGACPPPAQEIQDMAYNVMNDFPEMVKGYAFPFLDIYNCASVISWVDDSHVPFYTPMDSGEYQVAYYGGFGMPTVVLVGGTDHRVLFSTLSYFTSDTTMMRDSILRLFGVETGVTALSAQLMELNIAPNPATEAITLSCTADITGPAQIEVVDMTGHVLMRNFVYLQNEKNTWTLDISSVPEGVYAISIIADTGRITQYCIVQ